MTSGATAPVALLLDEMHSPAVAVALRGLGHDVIAVVAQPELRAMTDDEVFAWAAQRSRRIVTENVRDFRRLLLRAEESGQIHAGVLFTSSRTLPRSRRDPGPLIDVLHAWLCERGVSARPVEDWLRPAR